MPLPVTLTQSAKSAATVRLGTVEIFFSYETCVGFRDSRGPALVNPACVGLSVTTAKHISGFGLKGAPVADSERDFGLALSRAVGGAAMVMGWNAEDNASPPPATIRRGEILSHPPDPMTSARSLTAALDTVRPETLFPTWQGPSYAATLDKVGGILIIAPGGAERYFQPGDDANTLESELEQTDDGDTVDRILSDYFD